MANKMSKSKVIADVVRIDDIQGRIVVFRGVPVMLDFGKNFFDMVSMVFRWYSYRRTQRKNTVFGVLILTNTTDNQQHPKNGIICSR